MNELSRFGYTSCAYVSHCSFDGVALDRGGLLVPCNNNLTQKPHEVQENLGTSDEVVDSAQRSKQHEQIKRNDKKMESGT